MRSSFARLLSGVSAGSWMLGKSRPIAVHEVQRVADLAARAQPAVDLDFPRLRDVGGVAHVEQLDARAIRLDREHRDRRPAAHPSRNFWLIAARYSVVPCSDCTWYSCGSELCSPCTANSDTSCDPGCSRIGARDREHVAREGRRTARFRPHGVDVLAVVLHEIRFIHAAHLNGRRREGALRARAGRGDAGDGSDLRRAAQRHPQTVPQRTQQLFVGSRIVRAPSRDGARRSAE